MKFLKNYAEKWKKKSLWAKAGDILFYIFLISLIIPASRIEILGFVNRIRASVAQPSEIQSEKAEILSEADYNWELFDLEGNKTDFTAGKGKVLFINFWATWCPPCVGEMPEIEKLYKQFEHNEKIMFLMVTNDDPKKVKEFLERKHYTFPVYFFGSKTPGKLESSAIPTSFLISKAGKIVIRETGAAKWSGEKMVELTRKLIEE